MSQTASERAAVSHLRIADFRGRIRNHRAFLPQQRGRGHFGVSRTRADFYPAVLLADAGQSRNSSDVDEQLRLAQSELHQRDEAVASGQELSLATGRRQLRQRIVDGRGALVVECRRNHD